MSEAHAKASIDVQALATLISAEHEKENFMSGNQCLQLGYLADVSGSVDEKLEDGAKLLLQHPENRQLFTRVCTW
jgi:hypothetical protein